MRFQNLLLTMFWLAALPALADEPPAADANTQAPPAAAADVTKPEANTGPATDAIKAANDRLRKLIGEEKKGRSTQEITKELHGLFDIKLLAQRALVNHWDKMSAKQRTSIVDSLQSIIEKNYLNQLRDNIDYAVDYKGEEGKGDSTIVRTTIRAQRNGRPAKISVDYRLHEEGGTWHIYDVMTEEVSILENYRSQFNRIIAKDGIDGLITRMKSKLQA